SSSLPQPPAIVRFCFDATVTPTAYTLSLHDALPIFVHLAHQRLIGAEQKLLAGLAAGVERARHLRAAERAVVEQPAVLAGKRHADRKSTRLNSSHEWISYAVFCLKKKKLSTNTREPQ